MSFAWELMNTSSRNTTNANTNDASPAISVTKVPSALMAAASFIGDPLQLARPSYPAFSLGVGHHLVEFLLAGDRRWFSRDLSDVQVTSPVPVLAMPVDIGEEASKRRTQRPFRKIGVKDVDRGLNLKLRIRNYTSNRETKDFIVAKARTMARDRREKSGSDIG
jgi:hypothetical protein